MEEGFDEEYWWNVKLWGRKTVQKMKKKMYNNVQQ